MRVLIAQPQALGGSRAFWARVNEVDLWIALGSVQFTPTISNGDGTARKTLQAHAESSVGLLTLKVARRMQPLWNTPLSQGSWQQILVHRVMSNLDHADEGFTEQLMTDSLAKDTLGAANYHAAKLVRDRKGSGTTFIRDTDLNVDSDDRHQRLLDLCQFVGASELLCGHSMIKYLNTCAFKRIGVALHPAPPSRFNDRNWIMG